MIPDKGSQLLGKDSGSPRSGEPVFLAVGRLRRPHGVRGEIAMEVHTDFPERLRSGQTVFVGPNQEPYLIGGIRKHNRLLLLIFDGITNRNDAGLLRNLWVFIRTEDSPSLPEGEFYHHQILGLAVVTVHGDSLGKVEEILITGANDVLIVRDELGAEVLLPVIDEVVDTIDLDEGAITVKILPGLIPD